MEFKREGEIEKHLLFIFFTSQMTTTARCGFTRVSRAVQGPKHLGHFLLLSQECWQDTGLEVEQPGLKLVPMEDVNATDGNLILDAAVPAPELVTFILFLNLALWSLILAPSGKFIGHLPGFSSRTLSVCPRSWYQYP